MTLLAGFLFVCSFPVDSFGKGPLRLPWAECVRDDTAAMTAFRTGRSVVFSAARKEGLDASRPPIKPKKAMLHSLLIPGWGQLDNGSRKKAALLFVAEIFIIGGYLYENSLVNKGSLSEFERENHRTNRNSYVIYWFVSKIIGITDAYVDAQLADFDVDDIRPVELEEGEEE